MSLSFDECLERVDDMYDFYDYSYSTNSFLIFREMGFLPSTRDASSTRELLPSSLLVKIDLETERKREENAHNMKMQNIKPTTIEWTNERTRERNDLNTNSPQALASASAALTSFTRFNALPLLNHKI